MSTKNNPEFYKNPITPASSPVQLVFRKSAPLQVAKYTWQRGNKVRAFPNVDIVPEYMYMLYSFSFSADISVLDYQSAYDINDISPTDNFPDANTIPTFSLYNEGNGSAPILNQPLVLPDYYKNEVFRKYFKNRQASGTGATVKGGIAQLTGQQINNMQGSFNGALTQIPSLIGKAEVNLIMTIFAQEINVGEQMEGVRGDLA